VFITLYVTYDRFHHIYNPLNLSSKYETNKTKLFSSLIILFTSSVITLPHGFLMIYNQIERDCDGRDFFKKKLGNSSLTYYQIYFTFTEPILFWFIPGLLILFMNFYVIFKIVKSNRTRREKLGVQMTGKYHSNSNETGKRLYNTSNINKSKSNLVLSSKASNNKSNPTFKIETVNLISSQKEDEENKMNSSTSNNNLNANKITTSSLFSQMTKSKSNSSIKSSSKLPVSRGATPTTNAAQADMNKLSVNQLSHYITIIMVGFYFIFSTIPFGIMLSFQNNLTLRLDYNFQSKQEYLNDPLWTRYGLFREWVAVTKLFFVSNHCFNFFLYFLFNNLFRQTFYDLFVVKIKNCFVKRDAK
jgi:hypothetical protein